MDATSKPIPTWRIGAAVLAALLAMGSFLAVVESVSSPEQQHGVALGDALHHGLARPRVIGKVAAHSRELLLVLCLLGGTAMLGRARVTRLQRRLRYPGAARVDAATITGPRAPPVVA